METITVTARSKAWVNHEIVTVAVYLVGGELKYVDTEDVAMQALTLAPGRFSLRKYPEQVNIENVRTFLKDATREQNGRYLKGSGKRGWMLTPAGLTFARQASGELSAVALAKVRPTQEQLADTRWKSRETARLTASRAYEKWASGQSEAITRQDADDFFRIDDYVTGDDRERRLQRVRNLAIESGDPVLIQVSEHAAAMEQESKERTR
jgi:hypothetical protein